MTPTRDRISDERLKEIAALAGDIHTELHGGVVNHTAWDACDLRDTANRIVGLFLAHRAAEAQRPTFTLPLWKCRTCGCLWRYNLDQSMSLANAEQKSCIACERSAPEKCCDIAWFTFTLPLPAPPDGGRDQ